MLGKRNKRVKVARLLYKLAEKKRNEGNLGLDAAGILGGGALGGVGGYFGPRETLASVMGQHMVNVAKRETNPIALFKNTPEDLKDARRFGKGLIRLTYHAPELKPVRRIATGAGVAAGALPGLILLIKHLRNRRKNKLTVK